MVEFDKSFFGGERKAKAEQSVGGKNADTHQDLEEAGARLKAYSGEVTDASDDVYIAAEKVLNALPTGARAEAARWVQERTEAYKKGGDAANNVISAADALKRIGEEPNDPAERQSQ